MMMYLLGMAEYDIDSFLATPVKFAGFSPVGTWVDDGTRCDVCHWHGQTRGEPLLVEWEPSSDVIGDFSWEHPYGFIFVVTDRVAEFLKVHQFECDLLQVEYVPPHSRRKRGIVPYPYDGPKQWWVECNCFVDLDQKASGVKVETCCEACGRIEYTFRYKGIVIRKRDWRRQKMFRMTTNGRSKATFVTEEGRMLLEMAGFTNMMFSEAGEIVR